MKICRRLKWMVPNYFFSLSNSQKVGDLTQHKKLHVDKTKLDFKCDMCEYASYAKKYLNAHVIKVHRGKEHYKHICEHCGKKFLYPFDLKQHHVIISQLKAKL